MRHCAVWQYSCTFFPVYPVPKCPIIWQTHIHIHKKQRHTTCQEDRNGTERNTNTHRPHHINYMPLWVHIVWLQHHVVRFYSETLMRFEPSHIRELNQPNIVHYCKPSARCITARPPEKQYVCVCVCVYGFWMFYQHYTSANLPLCLNCGGI